MKYIYIVSFSIFFLALSSCSKKTIQHKLISNIAPLKKDTTAIEKINLYLETSVSMKGYVNANQFGGYKLKSKLPFFITNLDKYFKGKVVLHTVGNTPRLYKKSRERFFSELRTGAIMKGTSSKLQNTFTTLIKNVDSTTVNILVSDCILDLGKVNALTEGDLVTQSIYRQLQQKEDLGVAVFQYKSDFNGTYYFDRKNTGGYNVTKRPYYNSTLQNRPFYIWIMGKASQVKKVINANVFKEYQNIHLYNISPQVSTYQLLASPKKGKLKINTLENLLYLKKASPKKPITFMVGAKIKGYDYYKQLLKDTSNYIIFPKHFKKHLKLQLANASIINYPKADVAIIKKYDLNHFIELQFSKIPYELDEVQIVVNEGATASWYKSSTLTDDLQITSKELEGKTFAFNYITKAFDLHFKQQKPLIYFSLQQSKQ